MHFNLTLLPGFFSAPLSVLEHEEAPSAMEQSYTEQSKQLTHVPGGVCVLDVLTPVEEGVDPAMSGALDLQGGHRALPKRKIHNSSHSKRPTRERAEVDKVKDNIFQFDAIRICFPS